LSSSFSYQTMGLQPSHPVCTMDEVEGRWKESKEDGTR
jgi:hypothetical protein